MTRASLTVATMEDTMYVVIKHDPDPDLSWLRLDIYDPNSPQFEPIYRSQEDIITEGPLDPEWYRDPDNHVTLCMFAYDDEDNCKLIDSCGGIDFLVDSDDWKTGTFYSVAQLEAQGCPYLAQLAKEMGLS